MVYFVQIEDDGPIFIGTSLFPPEYLKAFWAGNCPKLRVLGSLPGDGRIARQIASDLNPYRVGDNYFDATDDVLMYLKRCGYVESYEWVDGRAYAVLWRETADSETEPCPFCGLNHYHREADGVCLPHCRVRNPYRHAADGTVLKQEDGYFVKTRFTAVVPLIREDEDITH